MGKMPTAGSLRERVTFAKRAVTDDGYGNTEAGDWADVLTCAASIEPLRGGETIQAARLAGRQPVMIKVRYQSALSAINTGWRVTDARLGTVYNVRSVTDPDMKKRFLFLECETGVAV